MADAATTTTRSRARKLTLAKRKALFLAELERRANVSAAARAAQVHRATAYTWRQSDAKFAAAWDEAVEVAVDALEAEAWRRAKDGWDEPVFQKGEEVGEIRRYSDTLMVTLLKGHRPDKFRERQQLEHVGKDGEALAGPIVQVYLPDNGRQGDS